MNMKGGRVLGRMTEKGKEEDFYDWVVVVGVVGFDLVLVEKRELLLPLITSLSLF